MKKKQKLKMLPMKEYAGVHKRDDPVKFYYLPLVGDIYRWRVERCLSELSGGSRVLEIGFGSGVTFLNLSEMYKEIHGLDLTADLGPVAAPFERRGIRPFLKNGDVLKLPYEDGTFESVLLISILEHLKPSALVPAFQEILRVLKPHGEVVYGAPVDRKLLNAGFKFLGYDIKEHHFSSEKQIAAAGRAVFKEGAVSTLSLGLFGKLYEVGHFVK
jgi:ubiquinone/menaquinone biosynthesis C-methylase UbiE